MTSGHKMLLLAAGEIKEKFWNSKLDPFDDQCSDTKEALNTFDSNFR